MVRSVSRSLAHLLLAGAALTLAGTAAAQSNQNSGAAAGTVQGQQPAAGGLILPGQVQTGPSSTSPAAGTIAPQGQRPQAAPAPGPAAGTVQQQAQPQRPAAAPAPQAAPPAQAQPANAARNAPAKPGAPKGAWEIRPDVFSDGTFKLCAAAAEFDNNLHLLVLQNADKRINLVLGVPGARMQPGQQVPVKLSVDGKVNRERPAVVSQPEAITINIGEDAELVKALGAGSRLNIEVPGDTAIFQLRGTTKALNDLGKCVDDAKAGTLKLPAPSQPMIAPQLAQMLVKAGLQDARAIPVDKIPPQQRPGDFAWQIGDKILGSVRTFPVPEEAGDFAAVSQKYVDQLKGSCEGNFTPNFGQVESVPAFQLRSGSAQCDAKEGKIFVSMAMQFVPLPKQQGQEKQVRVLRVFTHETVEAEKAKAESATQGIIKVLKEEGQKPIPAAAPAQQQGQARPAPAQGQARPAAPAQAAPKPAGQ